jgi:hypothetical protein
MIQRISHSVEDIYFAPLFISQRPNVVFSPVQSYDEREGMLRTSLNLFSKTLSEGSVRGADFPDSVGSNGNWQRAMALLSSIHFGSGQANRGV